MFMKNPNDLRYFHHYYQESKYDRKLILATTDIQPLSLLKCKVWTNRRCHQSMDQTSITWSIHNFRTSQIRKERFKYCTFFTQSSSHRLDELNLSASSRNKKTNGEFKIPNKAKWILGSYKSSDKNASQGGFC